MPTRYSYICILLLVATGALKTMQQKTTKAPMSKATQQLFDAIYKTTQHHNWRCYNAPRNLGPIFKALKGGADINAIGKSGLTPLGLAVSQNDYYLAMALLQHKDIDVNIMERMSYGSSDKSFGPVIFSVLDRTFENDPVDLFLKQMLVTKNVNLSLKNSWGYKPLEYSLRVTHDEQSIGNCQGHYRKKMVLLKMLVTYSSPTDVQNIKKLEKKTNFYWDDSLRSWIDKEKMINLFETLKDKDLKNFINIFARDPEAVITPEALHYVIDLQRINLMPYFYQQLKNQDWFTMLEKSYPVFKVCGDLIPNAKIGQATAKAFLKEKSIKGDDNLVLINQAYAYAKEHDLAKIGRFIRRTMTTIATLPEHLQDVSSLIASYKAELDAPLVSLEKKKEK